MVRRDRKTWTPKSDDYRQVFLEQNPWHVDGKVPDALAPSVERPLANSLWHRLIANEPRRFQLVLGPRRVGKTTCLYQIVRHLIEAGIPPRCVWWLRLDHPLLMNIDLGELAKVAMSLSERGGDAPCFLFLDELTYAEHWDHWLKTFYDEQWPIQLAGSSSSTAVLRGKRTESGIGRWDEQYLAPYLFPEFLDLLKKPVHIPVGDTLAHTIDACLNDGIQVPDLASDRRMFILTGGFPELLLGLARDIEADEKFILLQSQRTLRDDAVERAIYKDIPQAFGIDNPLILERVLYTLAGQFTGILSPSAICRSLDGTSQPTLDKYLSYLSQAFLVFTLQNYSGREETRQRRGRKLYFVDGAVRNAALQRGIAPLSDPDEMGLLIENLVAGHLHALSQQSQVRLYHWRDGKDEVDLIYDHPTAPIAFEVSSSTRHPRKAIYKFQERFPRFRDRCFLVAPTATPTQPNDNPDGIGTLPLDMALLAIGRQAARYMDQRLASPAAK